MLEPTLIQQQVEEIKHFQQLDFNFQKLNQRYNNPAIQPLIDKVKQLDLTATTNEAFIEREQLLDDLNAEMIKTQINNYNRILDISYLGLTRIPDKVMSDPSFKDFWNNLTAFLCNDNKLKSLPDSLGNSNKLQRVQVWDNQLQSLPHTLGNLTALEEFWCHNNHLESLPHALGNCTQLKLFDCSKNKLKSLPETLGNCASLESLDCRDNQLEALPDELGNCHALKRLDATNNQLKSLPSTLSKCPLESFFGLRVGSNYLTSIPPELSQKYGTYWVKQTLSEQRTLYSYWIKSRELAEGIWNNPASYLPSFLKTPSSVKFSTKRQAPNEWFGQDDKRPKL